MNSHMKQRKKNSTICVFINTFLKKKYNGNFTRLEISQDFSVENCTSRKKSFKKGLTRKYVNI